MKTRYEVFAALRGFFTDINVPERDRRAVWDTLTALRGPDNEEMTEKAATTEVIRYALIGKLPPGLSTGYQQDLICGSYLSPDTADKATNRKGLVFDHFKTHAKAAFDALGLMWADKNTME